MLVAIVSVYLAEIADQKVVVAFDIDVAIRIYMHLYAQVHGATPR